MDNHDGEKKINRTIIQTVIILIALGIAGLLIYKYITDLYFQMTFLKLFSDQSSYTIFSISHLLDVLNEILLIAPGFLIFLVLLRTGNPDESKKHGFRFLGFISLAALLFLMVVNPLLGMARDWDLFSCTIYPISLLMIFLINDNRIEAIKRLVVPIILLMTISVVPFLATNLNAAKSEKYAEYMVSLDLEISRTPLVILLNYYRENGEYQKVDSLVNLYGASFPNWEKCERAMEAMLHGKMDAADSIIKTIDPDPFDVYYQKLLGRMNFYRKNYDSALVYFTRAIQLKNYKYASYIDRAETYFALEQYEPGLDDLRHSLSLNDKDTYTLDMLVMVFSAFGKYDSSIYYGQKRLAIDSNSWPTYYELARAYVHADSLDKAKICFDKMAGYKINHIGYTSKLQEVDSMIKAQEPVH